MTPRAKIDYMVHMEKQGRLVPFLHDNKNLDHYYVECSDSPAEDCIIVITANAYLAILYAQLSVVRDVGESEMTVLEMLDMAASAARTRAKESDYTLHASAEAAAKSDPGWLASAGTTPMGF